MSCSQQRNRSKSFKEGGNWQEPGVCQRGRSFEASPWSYGFMGKALFPRPCQQSHVQGIVVYVGKLFRKCLGYALSPKQQQQQQQQQRHILIRTALMARAISPTKNQETPRKIGAQGYIREHFPQSQTCRLHAGSPRHESLSH